MLAAILFVGLHGCRNLDDYFTSIMDFMDFSGIYIFCLMTGLLFSGIQFPTDRSDDPLLIKCV